MYTGVRQPGLSGVRTVVAISAEGIDHVMRQTERNSFRLVECNTLADMSFMSNIESIRQTNLVEQAIEVNVKGATVALFEEDIFTVTITQATGQFRKEPNLWVGEQRLPKHISYHGHDGTRASVFQACRKP